MLVARRADGSIAKQWETSGGEPATTNNQMELMAVVAELLELPAPARARIHIDSSSVLYTFIPGRRERWQDNGLARVGSTTREESRTVGAAVHRGRPSPSGMNEGRRSHRGGVERARTNLPALSGTPTTGAERFGP